MCVCVLHLQTKNSSQVPSETKPASSVFDEELKSKIEENAMLHKKVNEFTTSTRLQRRISFATLYFFLNGALCMMWLECGYGYMSS